MSVRACGRLRGKGWVTAEFLSSSSAALRLLAGSRSDACACSAPRRSPASYSSTASGQQLPLLLPDYQLMECNGHILPIASFPPSSTLLSFTLFSLLIFLHVHIILTTFLSVLGLFLCIFIAVYICIYVAVYVYLCVCLYLSICMFVCVSVCVCVRTHVRVCLCVCIVFT